MNPFLRHRRSHAVTLVEVMISLTLVGLMMAAVTSQLLESGSLTLRTARSLEHARSARELTGRLAEDMRDAQLMVLHPTFDDRSVQRRDSERGNYLVLHQLDAAGAIVRTVGYYLVPDGTGTAGILYRHDSADGVLAAGTLPGTETRGTHRAVTRAVRLPDAAGLFRCVRDRAVSMRGEFGTPDAAQSGRPEFIQCTFATRS
jgi:type II secretory pathway pseudopilin PulG